MSPDGRFAVFRLIGDQQVWRIGLDGAGLRKVTSLGDRVAAWPAWSPDGKSLVFENKAKSWEEGTLSIVPADGGTAQPLLDDQKKPIRANGRLLWR